MDSPRIRGDDPLTDVQAAFHIFILPVFAGMIRRAPDQVRKLQHSPRIRGDDPAQDQHKLVNGGFSPYSRG